MGITLDLPSGFIKHDWLENILFIGDELILRKVHGILCLAHGIFSFFLRNMFSFFIFIFEKITLKRRRTSDGPESHQGHDMAHCASSLVSIKKQPFFLGPKPRLLCAARLLQEVKAHGP